MFHVWRSRMIICWRRRWWTMSRLTEAMIVKNIRVKVNCIKRQPSP
jgi:hypothetical protein